MDVRNLAGRYGLPPVDWAAIEARLDRGLTLAPDTGGEGRQPAGLRRSTRREPAPQRNRRAVGGRHVLVRNRERSRKGRNLARDPRCAMSVSTDEFDLVVEGTAEKVTDPATVARFLAVWAAGGWPARPDDTGEALTAEYSAPSAGPPSWHVYQLTAHSATGGRDHRDGWRDALAFLRERHVRSGTCDRHARRSRRLPPW